MTLFRHLGKIKFICNQCSAARSSSSTSTITCSMTRLSNSPALFRSGHDKHTGLRYLCTQSDSHEEELYDVIVSGGGMVGTAMATALGHSRMFADKRILVLEAGPEKPPLTLTHDRYASRTCALSHNTIRLLNSFGAWDNILQMRAQPVKRMQIWDSCSDSMITFNTQDHKDNLAYIVENDIILDAIVQQAKQAPEQVEIKYGSRVKSYQLPASQGSSTDHNWAQVSLEDGSKINCRLLIGADGFRSLLRQTARIHTMQWEYNQLAVVATLKLTEPMENTVAWQRFLPTGTIAMLPVSDQHSCLIWSTSPDDAKHLLSLAPENFVDAVNNAFWSSDFKNPIAEQLSHWVDGVLVSVGLEGSSSQQLPPMVLDIDDTTRGAFPLGLCHASQYVGTRMALIGDAAHRVHPLAGQGVNLGFGDVACLRDLLENSVQDGGDIGSINQLLNYEKERQRHVIPIMGTVDGLNKLYRTNFLPVVLLRTLGMQATNALTPLKKKMVEMAATS